MDWISEVHMTVQVILSFFLGAVIGWEREQSAHPAGIRTFGSIALGSCVFGLISNHVGPLGDPGRIAAQIVSGIGFMGVGVVVRTGTTVHGLTTAATLWTTAAIGLAVAFDMYIIAGVSTIVTFSYLFFSKRKIKKMIFDKIPNDQKDSEAHDNRAGVGLLVD